MMTAYYSNGKAYDDIGEQWNSGIHCCQMLLTLLMSNSDILVTGW